MKRRAWLGWAATAPAAAQSLDVPPPPGPQRAIELPALHELTLPNGLRVVLAQRDSLPLVNATLLVRAGPETDPPGRSGLAALSTALFTKGARRAGHALGALALARQAEALGASLASDSRWQACSIGLTVAAPRLDAALALLADVLRQPLLAADELARVRAQMLDALHIDDHSPASVAERAARRAFVDDARYAATPTRHSLRRIGPADVLAFHRRYVRPQQTVLVLAGALSAEAARAAAERHLGSWRRPDAGVAAHAPAAPAAEPAPLVRIAMPGSGQASVCLLLPFDPGDAAQRSVARVANAVLGLGYSARLNEQVRIRRGLSYDARSTLQLLPGVGWLQAQAQTDAGNAAAVLALMRDTLHGLATQPPAAAELQARRATLIGAFARQLDSVDALAQLLGAQIAAGRPLAELRAFVPGVAAVDAHALSAFAAAHWPLAAARAVVAGPDGGGFDGTAALPLARLDLDRRALRAP